MSGSAILIADYYPSTQRVAAHLVVCRVVNGRRADHETIEVSGKRDARQIAALLGATPNNF